MSDEHSMQVEIISKNSGPRTSSEWVYIARPYESKNSISGSNPHNTESRLPGNIIMYNINNSQQPIRGSNHLSERPPANAVSWARIRLSRHFVNGLRWG